MMTLDWKSCESIGSLEEYEVFDRIVSDHRNTLDHDLFILEVGSYHGQSTILLAQYGWVIAIDLWGDIHDGTAHPESIGKENLNAFVQNMNDNRLIETGRVFPIVSTSVVLNFLHPYQHFDLIYIDASHYYEPAKLDIERSKWNLAPDGLLVIHDYKRPGDRPDVGVNQAVDELIESGEFVIREHFGGLVVLKRAAK